MAFEHILFSCTVPRHLEIAFTGTEEEGILEEQSDVGQHIASATLATIPEHQQEERVIDTGVPPIPKDNEPETDNDKMQIVYVSSEVAPWSKTGGLGDVAGSLPIAMAKLGHRVMVLTPR